MTAAMISLHDRSLHLMRWAIHMETANPYTSQTKRRHRGRLNIADSWWNILVALRARVLNFVALSSETEDLQTIAHMSIYTLSRQLWDSVEHPKRAPVSPSDLQHLTTRVHMTLMQKGQAPKVHADSIHWAASGVLLFGVKRVYNTLRSWSSAFLEVRLYPCARVVSHYSPSGFHSQHCRSHRHACWKRAGLLRS